MNLTVNLDECLLSIHAARMKITAWIDFRNVAFALLFAVNAGCNMLDYDEQVPIAPLSGGAYPLSGFAAGDAASREFEWQLRGELLCVNIPAPGDYLLTYLETQQNDSGLFSSAMEVSEAASPAHIAFHANTPARLFINVSPDARLERLQLQRGTIAADAVGLYDDGPVIRFATPSIPTIFWSDVFFLDPATPPIVMKQRESVCPQDSARSPY